jgi:hypothetical protein
VTTAGAGDPAQSGKPPLVVTTVAVLALVAAVYTFVDGVLVLRDANGDNGKLVAGALQLALGCVALGVGVGALGMRRWAWVLFMTWAVIALTAQILHHFFFSDPNYVSMAVTAFAVFAFTPLDVQVAFGIRQPPNVHLSRPTRNPLDRD